MIFRIYWNFNDAIAAMKFFFKHKIAEIRFYILAVSLIDEFENKALENKTEIEER